MVSNWWMSSDLIQGHKEGTGSIPLFPLLVASFRLCLIPAWNMLPFIPSKRRKRGPSSRNGQYSLLSVVGLVVGIMIQNV